MGLLPGLFLNFTKIEFLRLQFLLQLYLWELEMTFHKVWGGVLPLKIFSAIHIENLKSSQLKWPFPRKKTSMYGKSRQAPSTTARYKNGRTNTRIQVPPSPNHLSTIFLLAWTEKSDTHLICTEHSLGLVIFPCTEPWVS